MPRPAQSFTTSAFRRQTFALGSFIVESMTSALAQHLRCWSFTAALVCALQPGASAEPIPVRHIEGTVHGFLALRAKDGSLLAVGDLFQVVRGDRVTSRLIFRFKD